ncbi:MAG: hypothetical protein ACKVS8_02650 [Phycisphaerales bacterium]
MAEHNVTYKTPTAVLMNDDVCFDVDRAGVRLGRLQVSKGRVDWFPKGAKHAIQMSWKQFADLVETKFDAAPAMRRR